MTPELQPSLFVPRTSASLDDAILFALGEFQSRGHALADRPIAFDRLRGAFLRSFERHAIVAPTDADIADAIRRLGGQVEQLPQFVAKHPYRITIGDELARHAAEHFAKIRTS